MPRKPRVSLSGVSEHIIQRGNNRQVIFTSDQDMQVYMNWFKEYSRKYSVAVHAWVLMTNHVHLLCTPTKPFAISQMMQSIGRRYVQYFNRTYQRSGTLWEGRFRSCLVQDELYLLQLYRYIELNPVRASMVEDPADYSWSTYQSNALGKNTSLLTPHSLYNALGDSATTRQSNYRDLFRYQVEGKSLDDIRKAANKGIVLGNERFINEVEELTGKSLKSGKRGRPIGWRKSEKTK